MSRAGEASHVIRAADDAQAGEAAARLRDAGLPLEGWDAPETRRFVLVVGGTVGGAVALEPHGAEVLLRSLVVEPALRRRGYGASLVAFALGEAAAAGAHRVYALTTTIPRWLARLGFVETTRERVPAALHASSELRGACPASARVFTREISGVVGRDAAGTPAAAGPA